MDKVDPEVVTRDAPEVPRLELTPKEEKAIDDAIRIMVKLCGRRMDSYPTLEQINGDVDVYRPLDSLIADTLKSLKTDVPDRPAEKLFDRIVKTGECGGDEGMTLGVIYVRLMNTMECISAVKGEYRGKRVRPMYTKEDAFKRLQERGLTRR